MYKLQLKPETSVPLGISLLLDPLFPIHRFSA